MAERKRPLKFLIQDADDLAVVSAHVQDAVLRVGDIGFERRTRRFVMMMNRLRWETARPRWRLRPFERVRAGLHFEDVTAIKVRGIDQTRPDDVLVLLAMTFEPGEAPAGAVRFLFAGGATLVLDVECLDGTLADVSAPWTTPNRPRHNP